eukprot:scaffold1291_cov129-Isochrysis_galbana.AAC.1
MKVDDAVLSTMLGRHAMPSVMRYVSEGSGPPRQRPALSITTRCLRPGLVGLYDLRSPTLAIRDNEAIDLMPTAGGCDSSRSAALLAAANIVPLAP